MQRGLRDRLAGLAMWTEWQRLVREHKHEFAGNPWFLTQDATPERFEDMAKRVFGEGIRDAFGMERDGQHGARVVQTSFGRVTRAWLDAVDEINFLGRHLSLDSLEVLDIGAGYGRLAAALSPYVAGYTCTDSVPISTEICREYVAQHCPAVRVLSLDEFCSAMPHLHPTIAINIHSWNECSTDQIRNWLDVLVEMDVHWLFTVSHKEGDGTNYRAWDGKNFRGIIADNFLQAAEEVRGLDDCPHTLWVRK